MQDLYLQMTLIINKVLGVKQVPLLMGEEYCRIITTAQVILKKLPTLHQKDFNQYSIKPLINIVNIRIT
jgi:hypothetical protein